jgi:hypothetical protein
MKISPVQNGYWDRMQQKEKGECENQVLLLDKSSPGGLRKAMGGSKPLFKVV